MTDLKTAAEILRRRLRDGLTTEAEVKAWADRLIDEADRPDAWLTDVSMARGKPELNEALELAPGEADDRAVFAGLMASLRDLLAHLWDDIDLARDGVWGELEAQRRRLRDFLERWSRAD